MTKTDQNDHNKIFISAQLKSAIKLAQVDPSLAIETTAIVRKNTQKCWLLKS